MRMLSVRTPNKTSGGNSFSSLIRMTRTIIQLNATKICLFYDESLGEETSVQTTKVNFGNSCV